MALYKAGGRVHVVDINHGQRMTETMREDSLTPVVQCPFCYNYHAILCTNTTILCTITFGVFLSTHA